MQISKDERERLVKFFGVHGANVIVSHIDDLEETFGSSAIIIKSVMQGKISQAS